jgi:hypothetical protein
METQSFIEENKQLGFTMKEEFVRDAIRFRLTWLKGENQCVEVSKQEFDKLNEAVKDMSPPYHSAENFINSQIKEALEKYEAWKGTRKRK